MYFPWSAIPHSVAPGISGFLLLIVAGSLPANLLIDLVASRHERVIGSIASLFVRVPLKSSHLMSFCPLFASASKHAAPYLPPLFVFTFQVRKGFWKPPPQIWLGDVSKIRVLDPHFLWETAGTLLHIPLYAKSKQVRHQTVGLVEISTNSRIFPTVTCSLSFFPAFALHHMNVNRAGWRIHSLATAP